jgi:heat shock protein HslJ
MKKIFFWFVIIITFLLLVGCGKQREEPAAENAAPAIGDEAAAAVNPPSNDVLETDSDMAGTAEELPSPEVFVPITVEDFGITTIVPADWPQIEGDPLLKNAWGPGEFRFVAFHSVPGENARPAMAQLLGFSLEELIEAPPEGEYWEEQIGSYDWALYNVDNPEIGLGQLVAMTVQEGTIYIVSLFIEMDYRDVVLDAVLENFNIESAVDSGEVEIGAVETDQAAEVTEIALLDTSWVLAMLSGNIGQLQEVLPGTEITAVFNPDGRVVGSSGCNDFASNFTVEDNSLTISIPAMTRMVCDEPQDIMLQETNFLSNLTAIASYQIEENELQLLDVEGNTILIFISR